MNRKKGGKQSKLVVDEGVEQFLTQVQLRPFIFDKSSEHHSNRDVMAAAWRDIGSACNISGEISYENIIF